MDNINRKVNIVLLKFSMKKFDILKEMNASGLGSLAARFSWNGILDCILSSDIYLNSAIREMYLDVLGREPDPKGLTVLGPIYRDKGWRSCLIRFVQSDEYRARTEAADTQSFLSALWRHLAESDDLPDLQDLASAVDEGAMTRDQALLSLLSRPPIIERESHRLWQLLTGISGTAPASVIAAFESAGREEAIRTICDLPEFELFATRYSTESEPAADKLRMEKRTSSDELNPYKNLPPSRYWKTSVGEFGASTDPIIGTPLRISHTDRIATAGSCFAQHLSASLVALGYNYLVTEHYQPQPGVVDEGYGVYPARFGNIYTVRHLLQLFERAYGLRVPDTAFWHGKEGGLIDPFRPRVQQGGFPSLETLLADRERHYRAVRQMFEQCDLFIFTLGLTETWISSVDGSVYPLAPGVVASRLPDDEVGFHNLSVSEVSADLERFLSLFAEINPEAKVVLTVSPVSIIATFEERHVLVSNVATKSILRAAADEICRRHAGVTYFPSYEMITGPQAGGKYYQDNLRAVSPEGVSFVMSVFAKHFLSSEPGAPEPELQKSNGPADQIPSSPALSEDDIKKYAKLAKVICDEEAILR